MAAELWWWSNEWRST